MKSVARKPWRALCASGVLGCAVMVATLAVGQVGGPVRALAPNYVLVAESPDPSSMPLYSPSIIRLDSGRLVACYTLASKDLEENGPGQEIFLTSDDGGLTWTERARSSPLQGRLFEAAGVIYYLSTGAGMSAMRSTDAGETWSEPVLLTDPALVWQQTPANVWHANGRVYLAYERRSAVIDAWGPSVKALVLLSARVTDDLTQASAWTFSSELVFADVVPGVRENDPALDYFGVPFFPQNYPNRQVLSTNPTRSMSPMGWVEPMVVQVMDPNHYWYDPTGKTFHILARAHTGGTGYACVTKVVEDADGRMTMSLEHAPSGVPMLFVPMPGGQMRFHILYDAETRLYWLLSSQATDSMTRIELLPPDRFDLPNNERHRLVLHFSKNLVDWCFAGLVDSTDSPRQARHYASMAIDGSDLVILSRSGDARAESAHEGNIITFHRVKNFRELVY